MKRSHRFGGRRVLSRESRSLRSAYARRAAFERLEDRWVLSPILVPFTTQAAVAGTAAMIAPAGGTVAAPTVTHTPAVGIGPITGSTTQVRAVGSGTVNIAVATANGQSATSPADRSTGSGIIIVSMDQLVFSAQPTDTTAGSVITPPVQVSIEDQNGNVITTDNSTVVVSLASNSSGGTLNGTLSVAAVNGVATFSDLSIDQPGQYSLAIRDSSLTNYWTSNSNWFEINPLPAELAFTTEPSNSTAGAAVSPAVQVSVEDTTGAVAYGDNSNVTLSLGSLGGSGNLSGTLTVAAVHGVATFNDLSVDKASSGYTLTAADGSLTGATSTGFSVGPGAPSQLVFVAQPGQAPAGECMGHLVVAVEDASGNLVTSDNSDVTMAIGADPGGGTLGGTRTVAAADGIAVFDNLSIDEPGAGYTLTAADGSLAGAPSVPFDVAPVNTGNPTVRLDWSGWGSPLVLTQAAGGQTPAVSISEPSPGTNQLRIDLGAGHFFAADSTAAAAGLAYENAGSPATSQYATIDISSPQTVSALAVALPGDQLSLGPIQDLEGGLGGVVADAANLEVAGLDLIGADGNADLCASGDLTVDANASILTGTGTISLAADVNADGSGDDGLGTLSIAAGAVVDSTNASADAITLRGAQVNIDTSNDPALVGAQHSVQAVPSATLTGITGPGTLAVDASGDLFATNGGNVIEFAPGATSPTATLSGLNYPSALAFDSHGNLFVANSGNDTVSEFAVGATTPTTTISGLNGYPSALAVDTSGDLFVVNGSVVSEFVPGATSPAATLSGLNNPWALAFDSHGNLFVANDTYPGSVSKFAPGATTPTATLTGVAFPAALAFDPDGNLFVGNDGYPNGSVSEFAPGATVPTATLTGTNAVNALAIDASGNVYACSAAIDSASISVFARGATTPTATFSGPKFPGALAIDGAGNLYVADDSWPYPVFKYSPGGSLPTAGGVVIRSSLEDRPMSLGGAEDAVPGINLTNAELAQIQTVAVPSGLMVATVPAAASASLTLATPPTSTITIGDSAQTGDITFTTAAPATTAGTSIVVLQAPTGPGKIILDDDGGAATALDSNGGSITLSAGTGGILAASPSNSAAEIAALAPAIWNNPGPSVTLDTTGPIGSAANPIQFADNPNTEQDVLIGQPDSTNEPSCVFLDSLGSLTLGGIYGETVNAPIDVTARTNLTLANGAVIDSGTSPLSLGADLYPGGEGNNGTGTLSIGPGAAVTSTDPAADAITLRGANITIDTSADPAVVGAPGLPKPTATLTGLDDPQALAVDAHGDLFVANFAANTVSEFAPGSTTPMATLTGLTSPAALAFDANGNRFVANDQGLNGSTVSEFAPGATTPTATLTGLDEPDALANDQHGDLFVANGWGDEVDEFAPGATTPTVIIGVPDSADALALDKDGNLFVTSWWWGVAEYAPGSTWTRVWSQDVDLADSLAVDSRGDVFVGSQDGTVVKFAPGATAPTATLSGVGYPTALACDANDNLYVGNAANPNNTVSVFPPGATAPSAVFGGVSWPEALVCDASGDLFVANAANAGGMTVSPYWLACVVDITVTTAQGTSAKNPCGDRFTYVAAPTVTKISPATGPTAGGTKVTITGTHFNPAFPPTVTFGSTAATGITVVSATQITVVAPPASAGVVDVTVTTPGGTSRKFSADKFTYTGKHVVALPPTVVAFTSQQSIAAANDAALLAILCGRDGTPISVRTEAIKDAALLAILKQDR